MIYLLSKRNLYSSVVLDTVYEFEDILASSVNGKILAPQVSDLTKVINKKFKSKANIYNKFLKKTNNFYQLNKPLDSEIKILFIIAISGADLDILEVIPNWRKKFDCVAAFICDAWIIGKVYPDSVRQLDHLFVPMPEIIDELKKAFEIPVSLIPFATDVLNYGGCMGDLPRSAGGDRIYDLISFGRTPDNINQAFTETFDTANSQINYHRCQPRLKQDFPDLTYEQRQDKQDIFNFFAKLRQAKICLCFDHPYTKQPRVFPHPFLTQRWFYGAATGCAILGKRPKNDLVKEIFGWEDATIELPDDAHEAVKFTQELLQQEDRLRTISRRNYYESLKHHDLRHRIRDMLQLLGFPLPPVLVEELQQLKNKEMEMLQSLT